LTEASIRFTGVPHLKISYDDQATSRQSEKQGGEEEKLGVIGKSPILYSLLFLPILYLCGGLGGYFFYSRRAWLSTMFFMLGVLDIALVMWLVWCYLAEGVCLSIPLSEERRTACPNHQREASHKHFYPIWHGFRRDGSIPVQVDVLHADSFHHALLLKPVPVIDEVVSVPYHLRRDE
jgi:hypothetical protein